MPWARASALDRHLQCSAASWLPRLEHGVWRPGYLESGVFVAPDVFLYPEEMAEDSEASAWGRGMHLAKSDPENPEGYPAQVEMLEGWREKLWPSHLGVHEQAVAYNCRTGEVIVGPTNLPEAELSAWKEAQDPDCVVGTCDWWANLPLGEPWVDDLKTGWRQPEVATPQTMFYLMCKCKVDRAGQGRVSITWYPKAADEPTREGLWRQVSGLALDGFEEDLQRAWRRTIGPQGREASPGPHCRYCPSQLDCDRAFE